jgi:hypothetical protein
LLHIGFEGAAKLRKREQPTSGLFLFSLKRHFDRYTGAQGGKNKTLRVEYIPKSFGYKMDRFKKMKND